MQAFARYARTDEIYRKRSSSKRAFFLAMADVQESEAFGKAKKAGFPAASVFHIARQSAAYRKFLSVVPNAAAVEFLHNYYSTQEDPLKVEEAQEGMIKKTSTRRPPFRMLIDELDLKIGYGQDRKVRENNVEKWVVDLKKKIQVAGGAERFMPKNLQKGEMLNTWQFGIANELRRLAAPSLISLVGGQDVRPTAWYDPQNLNMMEKGATFYNTIAQESREVDPSKPQPAATGANALAQLPARSNPIAEEDPVRSGAGPAPPLDPKTPTNMPIGGGMPTSGAPGVFTPESSEGKKVPFQGFEDTPGAAGAPGAETLDEDDETKVLELGEVPAGGGEESAAVPKEPTAALPELPEEEERLDEMQQLDEMKRQWEAAQATIERLMAAQNSITKDFGAVQAQHTQAAANARQALADKDEQIADIQKENEENWRQAARDHDEQWRQAQADWQANIEHIKDRIKGEASDREGVLRNQIDQLQTGHEDAIRALEARTAETLQKQTQQIRALQIAGENARQAAADAQQAAADARRDGQNEARAEVGEQIDRVARQAREARARAERALEESAHQTAQHRREVLQHERDMGALLIRLREAEAARAALPPPPAAPGAPAAPAAPGAPAAPAGTRAEILQEIMATRDGIFGDDRRRIMDLQAQIAKLEKDERVSQLEAELDRLRRGPGAAINPSFLDLASAGTQGNRLFAKKKRKGKSDDGNLLKKRRKGEIKKLAVELKKLSRSKKNLKGHGKKKKRGPGKAIKEGDKAGLLRGAGRGKKRKAESEAHQGDDQEESD
jgi:hypothetical protein